MSTPAIMLEQNSPGLLSVNRGYFVTLTTIILLIAFDLIHNINTYI